MQLYFVSVFFTLIVGLSLTFKGFSINKLFPGKEKAVTLVTGCVCVVAGVLKLIFVVQPGYVIIGDFVPAAAGVIGGLCYLLEYYNEVSDVKMQLNSFFETVFITGKMYIGIACIAAAVIHFLFPAARIL